MSMKEQHTQSQTRSEHPQRRFRDVSPSEAAEAELTWFFNEAESAIDLPSNYCGLIAGVAPTSLEEVERRAEALHAARKIHERLQRLRSTDALLLSGLYTERPWSDAVTKALPGGLAGAAEASPSVRVEYLRALARAQTHAKSVPDWIEEVVRKGRPRLLAAWREELELECAIAVRSYERVRGDGPSVVPQEDL
jgi:hypothetical protein